MGGGHTEETQLKGIQLQTSSYGLPIPIVYGTARLSANLIWYGNFQAIPHETSSGGKGGGFTSTSYTYKVAAMMALCEGPIAGIGSVWKGKDKSDLTTLGLTLFTGAQGQATWSWLTGYATPGATSSLYNISYASLENLMGYHGQTTYNPEALNYSGTAYLAASSYDLGTTTSIPNHGFEIQGLNIFGGTVSDANPSVVINDFLTNAEYGAGFSSGWLASLTNYSNYCLANGLFISPSLSAQKAAADIVKEWTDATNTALVWSEGVLKFIPYGDSAASKTINATVYSFTPNTTPLYDLTDDDFVFNSSQDPIKVDRITPADAFNRVQIEYLNRANQYNSEVVDVKDQRDIELYGLRTQPSIKMDFVCDSSVAKQVAQIILQRALYIRNTYEFQLGWEYSVLEPMDLVTLTDAALGLSKTPVRITEISEDVDGLLTVKAEDFPLGTASATLYPHDNGIRYQARINDAPQSVATPQFFEAPSALTTTGLQVWAAVGGLSTDALYGGCTVWVSLDGTNYKATGKLYGPSRYGVTTASLAAHAAGTDATNTLALALSANGQLNSATASDLAAGTSLVAVGQEYLAFQTATLTGTLAYNLTTLNRGLYNTNSAGAAHASGSPWARIDSAIGKSDNLAMSMIGKTIYFKFTAFNIYGGGEQSLASVTAYTYPITGYMTQLPPSNVASLSAAVDAALNVTLSWPAIADLDVGSYEIRDGAPWSTATVLGQVKGTTFKIPLVSGAHTYQVKAIDVNGNYSATAASAAITVSTSSAVTSLAVSAVTVAGSAGTQSPAFNISWTAANSSILQSTAIEYKKSADTNWIAYSNVTPPNTTAQIVGIEPGTNYDIRVAELYNNGVKSPYATQSAVTSSGSQTVGSAAAVPWTGVSGAAKPADNATMGDNYIKNSTFIGGSSAHWLGLSGADSVVALTGGPAAYGLNCGPGSARDIVPNDVTSVPDVPVGANRTFYLSTWVAADTLALGCTMFLYWYDNTGAQISNQSVSIDPSVINTYQQKSLVQTVPANAAYVHARYHIPAYAAGNVKITGLRLSNSADGATVGATWGVNVGSTPTELTDGRVPAALAPTTGLINTDKVITASAQNNSFNSSILATHADVSIAANQSSNDIASILNSTISGITGSKVNLRLDATIKAVNGYSYSVALKRKLNSTTSLSWVSSGYTVQTSLTTSPFFYVGADVTNIFSPGDQLRLNSTTVVTIQSLSCPTLTGSYPNLSLDYSKTTVYTTTSNTVTAGWSIDKVGGAVGGGAGDGYQVVQSWPNVFANNNFSGTLFQSLSLLFDDAPGAGAFDYKVVAGSNLNSAGGVSNIRLALWETKK